MFYSSILAIAQFNPICEKDSIGFKNDKLINETKMLLSNVSSFRYYLDNNQNIYIKYCDSIICFGCIKNHIRLPNNEDIDDEDGMLNNNKFLDVYFINNSLEKKIWFYTIGNLTLNFYIYNYEFRKEAKIIIQNKNDIDLPIVILYKTVGNKKGYKYWRVSEYAFKFLSSPKYSNFTLNIYKTSFYELNKYIKHIRKYKSKVRSNHTKDDFDSFESLLFNSPTGAY